MKTNKEKLKVKAVEEIKEALQLLRKGILLF